jgi:hypothetical protein
MANQGKVIDMREWLGSLGVRLDEAAAAGPSPRDAGVVAGRREAEARAAVGRPMALVLEKSGKRVVKLHGTVESCEWDGSAFTVTVVGPTGRRETRKAQSISGGLREGKEAEDG